MSEMSRRFSLCIPRCAWEEYLLVRARMVWMEMSREIFVAVVAGTIAPKVYEQTPCSLIW